LEIVVSHPRRKDNSAPKMGQPNKVARRHVR